MLTQIELNDALVTEAFRYVKVTTPTDLLNLALSELVANHQRQFLPETLRFQDYSPEKSTELDSLEEVVAKIQRLPQNLANIQLASGLLAEHLRYGPEIADPTFEVTAWNQAWDSLEAQMNALERAEQQAEGRAG